MKEGVRAYADRRSESIAKKTGRRAGLDRDRAWRSTGDSRGSAAPAREGRALRRGQLVDLDPERRELQPRDLAVDLGRHRQDARLERRSVEREGVDAPRLGRERNAQAP